MFFLVEKSGDGVTLSGAAKGGTNVCMQDVTSTYFSDVNICDVRSQ